MIKIRDLEFYYSKNKELFNGLSLNIETGKIYGLLGKNGAGKTTLMKLLTGILFPKKGELTVNGSTPRERNVDFLQELFYIPEELMLQKLSQEEYLKRYAFFYPKFDHEMFKVLLKEFNVPAGENLFSISQGQKKKYLISFALATNCKILFLDEPTNGLDIPSKSTFRKYISNYVNEDRTIIISTHQVRDVSNLIDAVTVLDEGHIVFNHTLEEASKVLTIKISQDGTVPPDSIYHKNSMHGTISLCEKKDSETTQIDIEILFNAIISNPDRIRTLFLGV